MATMIEAVAAKPGEMREQIDDLTARLESLDADAKPLREQLSNIDRQKSKLRKDVEALRSRLTEMNRKPRVSDHAVIRYLERRYNFDFEHVRDELLTDSVRAAMKLGAEGVKIATGTLKLRGNTIVTFIGKD